MASLEIVFAGPRVSPTVFYDIEWEANSGADPSPLPPPLHPRPKPSYSLTGSGAQLTFKTFLSCHVNMLSVLDGKKLSWLPKNFIKFFLNLFPLSNMFQVFSSWTGDPLPGPLTSICAPLPGPLTTSCAPGHCVTWGQFPWETSCNQSSLCVRHREREKLKTSEQ